MTPIAFRRYVVTELRKQGIDGRQIGQVTGHTSDAVYIYDAAESDYLVAKMENIVRFPSAGADAEAER